MEYISCFKEHIFIMELLKNVQEICKFEAVICFEEKTNLKINIMTIIVVIIIYVIITVTIIVIATVISRLNLKCLHKNIKKLTFSNKEFEHQFKSTKPKKIKPNWVIYRERDIHE